MSEELELHPPDAASAAQDDERSGPRVRRAGLVIGLALFALLLWAPGLALDPAQRRTAAVSALVATFWITLALPVGATSLLPVALFPLLGVLSARDAAASYMDDLVLLFLGAFLLALGLERWGVHRRMALYVISKVGTRPRRLVLGFFAATAFVSLWMNNTATALLMLPIALAVVKTVADERGEPTKATPFATALLLAIAYGASLGGMGTPVGTAPNQVFLGQLHVAFPRAPTPSFGAWVIGWLPMVVLSVLAGWLVLTRVVLRVSGDDVLGGAAVRAWRRDLGRMSFGARAMATVFAVTALLWATRSDLVLGSVTIPGWTRLWTSAHAGDAAWLAEHASDVTDATVAIAAACLCFVLPVDRAHGTYLLDWRTAARVPWDVLLLIGSGFCIARAFRASGLDHALGSALVPLLAGRPTWIVVGGVALVMTFLSEFTSNTAITNIMLPVLAHAATESGLHPLVMMVPATIAASCGFMLPVATPPNAIVFGSRLVPMGSMVRAGLVLDLVCVVLVTVVFEFWVRWVWGIGAAVPDWVTG